MEWEFIVAMVVMVPVILFPVAFVWYLNIGGLVKVLKERRASEEVKGAIKVKA